MERARVNEETETKVIMLLNIQRIEALGEPLGPKNLEEEEFFISH